MLVYQNSYSVVSISVALTAAEALAEFNHIEKGVPPLACEKGFQCIVRMVCLVRGGYFVAPLIQPNVTTYATQTPQQRLQKQY